jgi:cell division transport system permease protein
MLGLIGMIVLHARYLSNYVKENIGFSIMIKNDVKETEILEFQQFLNAKAYVKSSQYITKEQAAASLKNDLGEDFIGFLDYNPLLASIEIKFKADYAVADSLSWMEKGIMNNKIIKEIFYQKDLVSLVNENVRKITIILLGFCGLLLLIAIALINNTIRLSVYSRRFLIKTMQLVGATQGFIQKPFLRKSFWHGILSGIFAIGLLLLVIYWVQKQLPELYILSDFKILGILFSSIVIAGVLFSAASTWFAVRKHLRQTTDELYN